MGMETRVRGEVNVFCYLCYIYTNSIVTVCVFEEEAKFLNWSREFGHRTKNYSGYVDSFCGCTHPLVIFTTGAVVSHGERDHGKERGGNDKSQWWGTMYTISH